MRPRIRARALRVQEYYRRAAVRERIREYCGVATSAPGCLFLAAQSEGGPAEAVWERASFFPPDALDRLLEAGADLSRSLWDESSLLVHIDIDYLNPDRRADAFIHPVETFYKLEPVYRATRRAMRDWGIQACDLLTGEGYHFTAKVPLGGTAYRRLVALAGVPSWWVTHPARRPAWVSQRIDETQARAYAGLGQVLEHLGHEIVRRSARSAEVPVVLQGTVVGAGVNGRECVSIDLSHITYPLDVRHVRVAFGAYQKHRFRRDLYGPAVAELIPPMAAVPRNGAPLQTVLETSRDLTFAADLAERRAASLPDASAGLLQLLDSYEASALARFHEEFAAQALDRGRGNDDLASLAAEPLPPCIEASLRAPNDLLLRPEHIQNLTRFLLGRGWEARRVAGVVQAAYERGRGWGDCWSRMHPGWHAEAYVRSFAGMIASGLDRMIDFNCVSTREKGMCPGGFCGHDLLRDREQALLRMGR